MTSNYSQYGWSFLAEQAAEKIPAGPLVGFDPDAEEGSGVFPGPWTYLAGTTKDGTVAFA